MSTKTYDLTALSKDAQELILTVPDLGMPWLLLKHKAAVLTGVTPVACISKGGSLTVDPVGFGTRPLGERLFILAHEWLHWLLAHAERREEVLGHRCLQGMTDAEVQAATAHIPEHLFRVWGQACDAVINELLKRCGLTCPLDATTLDSMQKEYGALYKGTLNAEAVYRWAENLLRQRPPPPSGGEGGTKVEPKVGSGCAPDGREPERGEAQDDEQVEAVKAQDPKPEPQAGGSDAEGEGEGPGKGKGDMLNDVSTDPRSQAMAAIGEGSTLGEALRALKQKVSGFVDALKRAVSVSRAGTQRSNTWRKVRRSTWRNGDEHGRIVRPGTVKHGIRVAVLVDVSGSMQRQDLRAVIGHIIHVQNTLHVHVYLVVHTDRVEWKGWVKPGDEAVIEKACSYTGGTDFIEAYKAVELEGRSSPFTALVHFTDTMSDVWPATHAKELVVGLVGTDRMHLTPPRKRYHTVKVENRS